MGCWEYRILEAAEDEGGRFGNFGCHTSEIFFLLLNIQSHLDFFVDRSHKCHLHQLGLHPVKHLLKQTNCKTFALKNLD